MLRSLTLKFEHLAIVIEESSNLSTYSFDELMSSLQAHKDILSRSHENVEEKAFQVKGESCYKGKTENLEGQRRLWCSRLWRRQRKRSIR